jgi:histidyl-tRNA synthetase
MKYPEHIAGTRDYLGDEAERLLGVATACASTFSLYGYERVRLPVIERSDIFLQRSGEEIRSRMYIFTDPRGKTEICLRPEMTIAVARSFLERMQSRRLPLRLCYQGDVFRYEKVREGRYRQFLQAGIEFIGSENRVAADVEAVAIALDAVNRLAVTGHRLLVGDLELAAEFINSLPVSPTARARLLETFWRRNSFQMLLGKLAESASRGPTAPGDSSRLEVASILSSLGDDASRLLVREILSLFVERQVGHRSLDEIAERFLERYTTAQGVLLPEDCLKAVQEYLSIAGSPTDVFEKLENLLKLIGATPGPAFEGLRSRVELLKKQGSLPEAVVIDLGFRRGIEYYTGFIFEIHCDRLGPVSQICGGGRYDRLLSALGAARPIPAVGFALGLDRLLLALEKTESPLVQRSNSAVDAVLLVVGRVEPEAVWQIAQVCREAGWRVRAELDGRRLSAVLGSASEEEIPYAIIVGEDEMRDLSVRIKDMARRKEVVIPIEQLKSFVQSSGTDNT